MTNGVTHRLYSTISHLYPLQELYIVTYTISRLPTPGSNINSMMLRGLPPYVVCPISFVRQMDPRTFCTLSRQTSTFRQLTCPCCSVTYPICGVRTCRNFRQIDSSALSCRRSVSIPSVSVSRGFGTGRTVPPPHRMPVVVRDTPDVSDAILAIMRILSVAG